MSNRARAPILIEGEDEDKDEDEEGSPGTTTRHLPSATIRNMEADRTAGEQGRRFDLLRSFC